MKPTVTRYVITVVKRSYLTVLSGLLVLGCGAGVLAVKKQGSTRAHSSYVESSSAGTSTRAVLPNPSKRPLAADFTGATAWLNTDRPLSLQDLRGRVVVVDFWTSCCINCLQTLPILRKLESQFKDKPFVVIGVHSPKFEAEQEAPRLRSILDANEIHHPIAVDANMAIWNHWQVNAWPTILVLDTQGRVVWSDSGEPNEDELKSVIASALEEGRTSGTLVSSPPPGLHPPETTTPQPLSFPGKVIALNDGGVAVSDTGHNRIVLFHRDGQTRVVIGTGLAGGLDGSFQEASFRNPQGIAEQGNILYVADTANHLIRAIDLKAQGVSTIAGTGELGRGFLDDEEVPGVKQALRSPWDVLAIGNRLFIALAGSHQIGVLDLDRGVIKRFAGSGREARRDGKPNSAAFAQPSGLATDSKSLYVIDSETSSIRAIDLTTRETRTVVGKDLFVFGDTDGDADHARLQHPIGIAYGWGALWVTDTYNSKIKKVDPTTGRTQTLAGGADHKDLFEPGGLSTWHNELLIADTNHHRVVHLSPTGGAPQPLAVSGLAPPQAQGVALQATTPSGTDNNPIIEVIWGLPKDKPSEAMLTWDLPKGTGLNEEGPVRIAWSKTEGLAAAPSAFQGMGKEVQRGLKIAINPQKGNPKATLEGQLDLVLCDIATHRLCLPFRRSIHAHITFGDREQQSEATIALPAATP